MTDKEEKFDLQILPVKTEADYMKLKVPISPVLPDLEKCFVMVLIGPTNSGKSNLICNLIFRFFKLENLDYVYWISPTIKIDNTTACIREHFPNTIYEKYSDALIENIIKFQESFPKEDRPKTLIVIDDNVSENRCQYLNYLCCRNRHMNTSILISVQQIKKVAKIARNQASNVVLWRTRSEVEKTQIYEIYGGNYCDKKSFFKMFKYATQDKPYDFLYLKLHASPKPLAFKNFTEDITNKFCTNYEDEVI